MYICYKIKLLYYKRNKIIMLPKLLKPMPNKTYKLYVKYNSKCLLGSNKDKRIAPLRKCDCILTPPLFLHYQN